MNTQFLFDSISKLHSIGPDFKSELLSHLKESFYKKGQALKTPQRDCSLCFVVNGIVKASFYDGTGRERITRFWKEGDIIPLNKDSDNQPSTTVYLFAIENTTLIWAADAYLAYIYKHYDEAKYLINAIYLQDRKHADFLIYLLQMPLKDAYEKMTEFYPSHRISVQDHARYLGVDPKRISELRARRSS